jgi:type II secretion system protein I
MMCSDSGMEESEEDEYWRRLPCLVPGRDGRKEGQMGFTLLEVLVSLSIVAMAITVVLQLFSAGLRAISASDSNSAAVIKAEARMREVLDNEDLRETSWSEATPDGYRIDVYIDDVLKERTTDLQVKLLQVVLTTRWYKGAREKSLTLQTMKVVSKVLPVQGTQGTPGATSAAAPVVRAGTKVQRQ